MKRVVLTGNGLSVGLNRDFSLENITKRFFERLDANQSNFYIALVIFSGDNTPELYF